jgi:excisionase family DNA binding protein
MEEILKELTKDISKDDLKTILEQAIKEMSKKKVTLTIDEAAELSGIGEQKIRELVAKNNTDFPYFKIGTKTLIYKTELLVWLEKVTKEHRVI